MTSKAFCKRNQIDLKKEEPNTKCRAIEEKNTTRRHERPLAEVSLIFLCNISLSLSLCLSMSLPMRLCLYARWDRESLCCSKRTDSCGKIQLFWYFMSACSEEEEEFIWFETHLNKYVINYIIHPYFIFPSLINTSLIWPKKDKYILFWYTIRMFYLKSN